MTYPLRGSWSRREVRRLKRKAAPNSTVFFGTEPLVAQHLVPACLAARPKKPRRETIVPREGTPVARDARWRRRAAGLS
jgi:hypothetical protein